MDYNLLVNNNKIDIKAEPGQDMESVAILEGDSLEQVKCRPVSGNRMHMEINGQAVNVYTAESEEGLWVWINGRARLVADGTKANRRKSSGPGAQGPDKVTPPTPATVVRIAVEMGEMVEKGQPCAVVSAMKMEITLPAPYAGKVIAINAEAGSQVSPGDIIVAIEPMEESSAQEGSDE